jgi:hypothetical protein
MLLTFKQARHYDMLIYYQSAQDLESQLNAAGGNSKVHTDLARKVLNFNAS